MSVVDGRKGFGMDVIVRDSNGNELFRSNRLGAATGGKQWLGLTGYGVESAAVTFTADYVVVTLALDEGIYPPPESDEEIRDHLASDHDESVPAPVREFLSDQGLRDAHTIAHGHRDARS